MKPVVPSTLLFPKLSIAYSSIPAQLASGNGNGNGNGKVFTSVVEEQKEQAAAVGLNNGQSVLPDTRKNDRERLERYDPHTVTDSMMYATTIPKQTTDLYEQAKQNCLADYVSKIEGNLSEFSTDQINHLLKILSKEKLKRVDVESIDF